MGRRRRQKFKPLGSSSSIERLRMVGVDDAPTVGIAAAGESEGSYLGVRTKAGLVIRYESARCTCGGENSNCFKCDGTGVYRREIVEEVLNPDHPPQMARFGRAVPRSEASFSSDPRGDDRGIRELGRFSSNPLYDGDV